MRAALSGGIGQFIDVERAIDIRMNTVDDTRQHFAFGSPGTAPETFDGLSAAQGFCQDPSWRDVARANLRLAEFIPEIPAATKAVSARSTRAILAKCIHSSTAVAVSTSPRSMPHRLARKPGRAPAEVVDPRSLFVPFGGWPVPIRFGPLEDVPVVSRVAPREPLLVPGPSFSNA
jgi:hypothetical protein